jgi:hypothetical protein
MFDNLKIALSNKNRRFSSYSEFCRSILGLKLEILDSVRLVSSFCVRVCFLSLASWFSFLVLVSEVWVLGAVPGFWSLGAAVCVRVLVSVCGS